MDGLCECGCGGITRISTFNDGRLGYLKGQHLRFLPLHHSKRTGKDHQGWKGGRVLQDGYIWIRKPDHPMAKHGYVSEARFLAEQAFGKPLSPKIPIHHIDDNKGMDDPHGLVICQSRAYHNLIHQRTRALKECGNVHWLKCQYCKKYDDPKNLYIDPVNSRGRHRECSNKYLKEWKARRNDRPSI